MGGCICGGDTVPSRKAQDEIPIGDGRKAKHQPALKATSQTKASATHPETAASSGGAAATPAKSPAAFCPAVAPESGLASAANMPLPRPCDDEAVVVPGRPDRRGDDEVETRRLIDCDDTMDPGVPSNCPPCDQPAMSNSFQDEGTGSNSVVQGVLMRGGRAPGPGPNRGFGRGGGGGGGGGNARQPPASSWAGGILGHSGAPDVRQQRVQVAEENYQMRRKWPLPKTVPVPWVLCAQYLEKAGSSTAAAQRNTPEISFSGWSTADALLHFAYRIGADGKKVCGLNFANGVRVGGGYKTGALAQEEDLCRRLPNLYSSLYNAKQDGLYPFGPSTYISKELPEKYCDVLYTPDLVLARLAEDQQFRFLPMDQQPAVSLVTAAAPNIKFASEVKDLELMYNTVRAVFTAPLLQQHPAECLVLGAWGCGAFGGDPFEISELFTRALREGYGKPYKHIHFAIPRPANTTDINQEVFRKSLEKNSISFKELS